jgi:hypothetical protein
LQPLLPLEFSAGIQVQARRMFRNHALILLSNVLWHVLGVATGVQIYVLRKE